MKKNQFHVVIPFILLFFGFVSCSFNKQETKISINIPTQISENIFSAREVTTAEGTGTVKQIIQVQLFVNSQAFEQQRKEYNQQDLSLSFDSVPIGAQVYAEASFLEVQGDEEKIVATGESETITVNEEDNKLTVVITLKEVVEKDPDNPNGTTEPDDPNGTTDPDDPNGTTEPDDPNGTTDPDNPNGTTDPDDPNGTTDPDDPNGTTDPAPDTPVIVESSITFELNGGAWVTDYTVPQKYTEGTGLVLPDAVALSKTGYGFNGWKISLDGGTTISENTLSQIGTDVTGDIILYATWLEGAVNYTIQHYKQNLEDDNYTLALERTETGKTGDTTNAQALEYTGFTSKQIVQQTIEADGTTVVQIKYDRNVHKVIYDDGVSDEDITVPAQKEYKYGATVDVDFSSIGTRTNWKFAYYINGSNKYSATGITSFEMPDNDVTLTAVWEMPMGGISANIEVPVFDIVVKKDSEIITSGQLLENVTGSFTLTLDSVGGVAASGNNDIQCMWMVDGKLLEPPETGKNGIIISPGYMPAGFSFPTDDEGEIISQKAIIITSTSSTNEPTISPGVHDIILRVSTQDFADFFTLQIKN